MYTFLENKSFKIQDFNGKMLTQIIGLHISIWNFKFILTLQIIVGAIKCTVP